ncbi:MAG: 3-phosphoshikimate 1-carboxyvinyltransferase [Clostridia bacterium]|nr:3-phosphoshikimate 1-carboxyvinyltransferase [Clostridia bacterium]
MKVKIGKSIAKGEIYAPPSKSYAHRLLICGALTGKSLEIDGISDSEDMGATLDCISALGGKYIRDGRTVKFSDVTDFFADGKEFFCRESGSTIRFFIPIALAFGGNIKFHGSERLMSRGFSAYEDICREQNIILEYDDRYLTLKGKLKSGEFKVKGNISSQFISGLMFALPLLDGDSVIKVTTELESRPYVDITIDALQRFGVEIKETEKNTFFIKGNQIYKPNNLRVEGDFSNSAFLDAFNILGGEVSVLGLNSHSYQGDKAYIPMLKALGEGAPTLDISNCPDLGPLLFAVAGVKHGAVINGTARLRIKESDRCETMKKELSKFGIDVRIYDNSVHIISPKELKAPSEPLYGHGDHRIVMALSVISTLTGAEIEGAEAVSKSYPDFFEAVATLGVEVNYEKTDKGQ